MNIPPLTVILAGRDRRVEDLLQRVLGESHDLRIVDFDLLILSVPYSEDNSRVEGARNTTQSRNARAADPVLSQAETTRASPSRNLDEALAPGAIEERLESATGGDPAVLITTDAWVGAALRRGDWAQGKGPGNPLPFARLHLGGRKGEAGALVSERLGIGVDPARFTLPARPEPEMLWKVVEEVLENAEPASEAEVSGRAVEETLDSAGTAPEFASTAAPKTQAAAPTPEAPPEPARRRARTPVRLPRFRPLGGAASAVTGWLARTRPRWRVVLEFGLVALVPTVAALLAANVLLSGMHHHAVAEVEEAEGYLLAADAPALDRAHAGAVTAVAIAPDGDLVASAGLDGMIRLWETGGKRAPRRLSRVNEARAPYGGIQALTFVPHPETGEPVLAVLSRAHVFEGFEGPPHERYLGEPASAEGDRSGQFGAVRAIDDLFYKAPEASWAGLSLPDLAPVPIPVGLRADASDEAPLLVSMGVALFGRIGEIVQRGNGFAADVVDGQLYGSETVAGSSTILRLNSNGSEQAVADLPAGQVASLLRVSPDGTLVVITQEGRGLIYRRDSDAGFVLSRALSPSLQQVQQQPLQQVQEQQQQQQQQQQVQPIPRQEQPAPPLVILGAGDGIETRVLESLQGQPPVSLVADAARGEVLALLPDGTLSWIDPVLDVAPRPVKLGFGLSFMRRAEAGPDAGVVRAADAHGRLFEWRDDPETLQKIGTAPEPFGTPVTAGDGTVYALSMAGDAVYAWPSQKGQVQPEARGTRLLFPEIGPAAIPGSQDVAIVTLPRGTMLELFSGGDPLLTLGRFDIDRPSDLAALGQPGQIAIAHANGVALLDIMELETAQANDTRALFAATDALLFGTSVQSLAFHGRSGHLVALGEDGVLHVFATGEDGEVTYAARLRVMDGAAQGRLFAPEGSDELFIANDRTGLMALSMSEIVTAIENRRAAPQLLGDIACLGCLAAGFATGEYTDAEGRARRADFFTVDGQGRVRRWLAGAQAEAQPDAGYRLPGTPVFVHPVKTDGGAVAEIVVAFADGRIAAFDPITGQSPASALDGFQAMASAMDSSGPGGLLVVGSTKGTLRLFHTEAYDRMRRYDLLYGLHGWLADSSRWPSVASRLSRVIFPEPGQPTSSAAETTTPTPEAQTTTATPEIQTTAPAPDVRTSDPAPSRETVVIPEP